MRLLMQAKRKLYGKYAALQHPPESVCA